MQVLNVTNNNMHAYIKLTERFIKCLLVVAWLSGSKLVLVNKVTQHQGCLVLGWVTVFGQTDHLKNLHKIQLP